MEVSCFGIVNTDVSRRTDELSQQDLRCVYVRVCFVVPGFGTELVTDCGTLSFISSTHSLGKKPTCEEQRRFEKLLLSLETDMPRLHNITLHKN